MACVAKLWVWQGKRKEDADAIAGRMVDRVIVVFLASPVVDRHDVVSACSGSFNDGPDPIKKQLELSRLTSAVASNRRKYAHAGSFGRLCDTC